MELTELKIGSGGDTVRDWQLFLVFQGIKMDIESNAGDGIFGTGTQQGTQEYQSKKGLSATGIVDSATYAKAIQEGLKQQGFIG